jgi:hypothetical protein
MIRTNGITDKKLLPQGMMKPALLANGEQFGQRLFTDETPCVERMMQML